MASSATEYLLELLEEGGDDAMDFWATVSEIAGATITAFSTEVPEWLKAAAREQLSEVFQYDYWLNVGETTREAVRATIERGINDGLSIREVADLIQEERGEGYARYRAVNTARTETNNALNRGASSAIETLEQETGLEMQKEWMSQYSTTTRPNHAAMDGQVSVGPNKLFAFIAQDGNTYNIPEPGDPSLPPEDRCQCGCGVLSSFVGEEVDRSDLDAVREELLATDSPTLIGMERSHHRHGTKYSEDQPRDEAGRFGSGGGSEAAAGSSAKPKEWDQKELAPEGLTGKAALDWFVEQDPVRGARLKAIVDVEKRIIGVDWGTNSWSQRPVKGEDALRTGAAWAHQDEKGYTDLYFDKDYRPSSLAREIDGDLASFEKGPLAGWLPDDYQYVNPAAKEENIKEAASRRIGGEDWGQIITRQIRRMEDGAPMEKAWASGDQSLNQRAGTTFYHPATDLGYSKILRDAVKDAPDTTIQETWRGDRHVPKDLATGDTVHIGIGSFSKSERIAENFARGGGDVLVLPKGERVYDSSSRVGQVRGEDEIMVSGKYEVESIETRDDGSRRIKLSTRKSKSSSRVIRLDPSTTDMSDEFPFALWMESTEQESPTEEA